jgi:hypothetical protein
MTSGIVQYSHQNYSVPWLIIPMTTCAAQIYKKATLAQDTKQICRHKLDFYYPQSSLTIHQKGPYCFGIRLFNHLPLYIKELVHDNKQFKKAVSVFLHTESFYTIEEYFSHG